MLKTKIFQFFHLDAEKKSEEINKYIADNYITKEDLIKFDTIFHDSRIIVTIVYIN